MTYEARMPGKRISEANLLQSMERDAASLFTSAFKVGKTYVSCGPWPRRFIKNLLNMVKQGKEW